MLVDEDGATPYWDETFCFRINVPEMAFVRFLVIEKENSTSRSGKFLGQATYPLSVIRSGIRNVALRNAHNEVQEMARLLVKVERKLIVKPNAEQQLAV